jgi:hypothetical protein
MPEKVALNKKRWPILQRKSEVNKQMRLIHYIAILL